MCRVSFWGVYVFSGMSGTLCLRAEYSPEPAGVSADPFLREYGPTLDLDVFRKKRNVGRHPTMMAIMATKKEKRSVMSASRG